MVEKKHARHLLTYRTVLAKRFRKESVNSIHCKLNGEPIGYAQSYVALGSGGRMVGKKKPIQEYAEQTSHLNASQLGKGLGTKLVRALVELLFNDQGHQDPNGPVAEQRERSDATRKRGLERQGTGKSPQMVQPCTWFKHARHSSEHAVLPNPSIEGTSKGWRPWPPLMSNVKHHEGSGIEVSTTIRGSWRHRAPSRTDVAGRTFVRLRSDGLKPHSDIDLLVTVTVRLDETTRRALINDL